MELISFRIEGYYIGRVKQFHHDFADVWIFISHLRAEIPGIHRILTVTLFKRQLHVRVRTSWYINRCFRMLAAILSVL